MAVRRASAVLLCLAAACGPLPHGATESRTDPVIYGTDDRHEYFDETDAVARTLLRDSTAVLVRKNLVNQSNPSHVTLNGQPLMDAYGTCAGERYADEPTPGDCSTTLIDDDLMLTAGHCIESAQDCASYFFVFHFYEESSGQLATISSDDVYSCASVIAATNTQFIDYSIVRLDRPATPAHTPARVAKSRTLVATGDPILILGYPLGMPGKSDRGHVVNAHLSRADAFDATIDVYEGSSGSAAYNALNEVVGIEVAGEEDFTPQGQCWVTSRLADDGSQGSETLTYVFHAIDALCTDPQRSARLCGGGPDAGMPDAGNVDPGMPDAGATDAGTTDLPPPMGCGCSGTPGLSALLALVALARRQRHPRRR